MSSAELPRRGGRPRVARRAARGLWRRSRPSRPRPARIGRRPATGIVRGRARARRLVRRGSGIPFHIVWNHAFVDGNKRAGLLSALVFLDVNGITIAHPSESLYELTIGVAEGRVDKPAIAAELERIARSRP